MSTSIASKLGRGLRGVWWLLDFSRRALLNLLLLALLAALVWGLLRSGAPALKDKTALVLNLSGSIAEQRAGSTQSSALAMLQGQEREQIQLRDLLAVLDAAAKDTQITHALLMLDDFGGSGLATLREVAAALERFKAAGKPIIAWGSSFDQRQYFLAAHASEVWLHPMGAIAVEGYGRYRSYYKDLFDKLGVSVNVIRAGKFKSFGETYSENGPSKAAQEADRALYDSLWGSWTAGVEKARKQPTGSVSKAIDSLPDSLLASGGDLAQWSLQQHWVDGLKTRDEMRAALIERGAKDEANKTFVQVSFGEYLGRIKPRTDGDAVAVIVAEGSIGDGRAGPGTIGGLSTGELIRKAREDDKIKALVLRVDSPGGSAFGSELVRRELELTRKAGKPVVVSMGDVAASGGYWISLAADEMIADEATITGSIGVIAVLPTAQGTLDKLGVHTGGVTTTWLGGAFDPRRNMDPRFVKLVQTGVDHTYRDFTSRAAHARKTTPEKIDAVAQGRVWSGKDALAQGLVDRLGSYGDALQSAATRGKLDKGFRVQYFEAEPGRLQRWLQRFGLELDAEVGDWLAPRSDLQAAMTALGLPAQAVAPLAADLVWLAELAAKRQPYAAVVHCLCSAP